MESSGPSKLDCNDTGFCMVRKGKGHSMSVLITTEHVINPYRGANAVCGFCHGWKISHMETELCYKARGFLCRGHARSAHLQGGVNGKSWHIDEFVRWRSGDHRPCEGVQG